MCMPPDPGNKDVRGRRGDIERIPYVCECDDVACHDPILLTAEEYERIRADGATFAFVPGHDSDAEVVEEHERYLIVRKPDVGGEVARALDPRREGEA